jgi:hypothetical protein
VCSLAGFYQVLKIFSALKIVLMLNVEPEDGEGEAGKLR